MTTIDKNEKKSYFDQKETDHVINTIWLTKYWEDMGIVECLAVRDENGDLMVRTGKNKLKSLKLLPMVENSHWFSKKEDAIYFVRKELSKELARLKKQFEEGVMKVHKAIDKLDTI